MKRLAFLLIIVMMLPVVVFGQTEQNIWITVSISESVIILATATNWDIGSRVFSTVTNRATASVISNGCNANLQLELQITQEASDWSAATNIAVNGYALTALIGTNQSIPAVGDYVKTADVVSTIFNSATISNYGNTNVSLLHGGNVAPAAKRNLWLKFETPSGGITTQQTIKLTISATVL